VVGGMGDGVLGWADQFQAHLHSVVWPHLQLRIQSRGKEGGDISLGLHRGF
jgi:hypothetical protein